MRSTQAGFTLIELLVAIAVIGVMAANLFPVLARAREKGRQTACLSNVRQLGIADRTYAEDNDGYFPPYHNIHYFAPDHGMCRDPHPPLDGGACDPRALHEALSPYVGAGRGSAVWFCPDDPLAGIRLPTEHSHRGSDYSSYRYNPSFLIGLRLSLDGSVVAVGPRSGESSPPTDTELIEDRIEYGGRYAGPDDCPHSAGVNVFAVDGHAKWRACPRRRGG
jgi:prepilin-type N-terminal cleavage/methylation domain-containing protein/prepilin-type processing-associated H-X9-DG protein